MQQYLFSDKFVFILYLNKTDVTTGTSTAMGRNIQ